MSTTLVHDTIEALLRTEGEEILRPLSLDEQRALYVLILAVDLYGATLGYPRWRAAALTAMRAIAGVMSPRAREVARKAIPLVLGEGREPDLLAALLDPRAELAQRIEPPLQVALRDCIAADRRVTAARAACLWRILRGGPLRGGPGPFADEELQAARCAAAATWARAERIAGEERADDILTGACPSTSGSGAP